MVSGNSGEPEVDVFDTEPKVPPVAQEVIREINRAANSEYIQVTASKVTPKIGAKARNTIYTIGVWVGVVGAIAPIVAGVLTGDAANYATTVGGIALALTNLMAKLNLSKTAADLAKEHA